MDLFETIRKKTAEVMERDPESIKGDDDLVELGLDSFATIELYTSLEDFYDIEIGLEKKTHLRTLNAIEAEVKRLIAAKG
ncbi:MAG: phosphopantetheine-binding protein [Bacteroidota bacterium]